MLAIYIESVLDASDMYHSAAIARAGCFRGVAEGVLAGVSGVEVGRKWVGGRWFGGSGTGRGNWDVFACWFTKKQGGRVLKGSDPGEVSLYDIGYQRVRAVNQW